MKTAPLCRLFISEFGPAGAEDIAGFFDLDLRKVKNALRTMIYEGRIESRRLYHFPKIYGWRF